MMRSTSALCPEASKFKGMMLYTGGAPVVIETQSQQYPILDIFRSPCKWGCQKVVPRPERRARPPKSQQNAYLAAGDILIARPFHTTAGSLPS
jgi:hypothetical protein